MNSDAWHYVVGSDSKGPFTTLEMEGLIGRGEIGAQTLVWNENLPVWEPAARHFQMTGPAVAAPGVPTGEGIGPDGLYVGAPSRGFVEAFKVCISKYATFSGRASRSEYWYFVLWQMLIGFVTGFFDGFMAATLGISFLNSVASLALLIPTLAVSWRRLHDIDRTGWWIGGFYVALLLFVIVGVMIAETTVMTGADGGPMVILFGVLVIAALIYGIVTLVFFCTRGTLGPNRYG